jgi:hypothetical protein
MVAAALSLSEQLLSALSFGEKRVLIWQDQECAVFLCE